MKNLKQNIWKLKWLRILHDFFIIIPILTIFFLARWLDMKEVFIIQSFFALIVLVWEVPSGYFADKYWRKLSIIIWVLIWFLSIVLYPLWEWFWYFMMIEWIIWIWISMLSWADSALLYDTLFALKREKEYHKIESSFFAFSWYWLAIASVLWWFLAGINLELPFYIQMFVLFFTIPLAFSLKEAPMHKHVVKEDELKWMRQIMFHYLHKHKEVKWLIIFSWFLSSSTLASVWFSQPFWQSLSIPISLFWILWAMLALSRALFTKLSPYLEKKLTKTKLLFLLISIVFFWYMWLAIFDKYIWSILFVLCFQAAFWISSPLFKKYINELVYSKIRATVLSINSMFTRLTFVILWPIIWYFFDVFTYREAFLLTWWFFFLTWLFSIVMMKKYKLL